jgi:riboflavin kinase/FMN adenylyltransferase
MRELVDIKQKTINGYVVKGRQIGRLLGFPTANLQIKSNEIPILKRGVYDVRIQLEGNFYKGVMNIGIRPTFKEQKPVVSFEVHILNLDADIYGKELMVEIKYFIRGEKYFKTKEDLIKQINHDIQMVKGTDF